MSRSGSPADAMTASTTEIPELAGVEPHGDWEPTPWLAAETHPLLRSRNFYIALTVDLAGARRPVAADPVDAEL